MKKNTTYRMVMGLLERDCVSDESKTIIKHYIDDLRKQSVNTPTRK